MTAVVACLPSWYLPLYVRGEASPWATFAACMLAMLRAVVQFILWPVDLTWRALMTADTMIYELMAIATEFGFIVFALFGGGPMHAVLMRLMPDWSWACIGGFMFADHLWCVRARDHNLRAMAVMLDVIGYGYLLFVSSRALRFQLSHVFLIVFVLMGIVVVLSLRGRGDDE